MVTRSLIADTCCCIPPFKYSNSISASLFPTPCRNYGQQLCSYRCRRWLRRWIIQILVNNNTRAMKSSIINSLNRCFSDLIDCCIVWNQLIVIDAHLFLFLCLREGEGGLLAAPTNSRRQIESRRAEGKATKLILHKPPHPINKYTTSILAMDSKS